jgi:hypothetical protein
MLVFPSRHTFLNLVLIYGHGFNVSVPTSIIADRANPLGFYPYMRTNNFDT